MVFIEIFLSENIFMQNIIIQNYYCKHIEMCGLFRGYISVSFLPIFLNMFFL